MTVYLQAGFIGSKCPAFSHRYVGSDYGRLLQPSDAVQRSQHGSERRLPRHDESVAERFQLQADNRSIYCTASMLIAILTLSGVFRILQGGGHGERKREPITGLGTEPPAGSRGRAPGQRVRGGAKPPEAETLLAFGRSMENLPTFIKFGNAPIYRMVLKYNTRISIGKLNGNKI